MFGSRGCTLNLQQRILEVFADASVVPAGLSWKEVHARVGLDVERMALDVGLNALVRAGKLTLTGLRYSCKRASLLDVESSPTPSADEEVAAALQPAPAVEEIICSTCNTPRPVCEFRLCGPEKRARTCNRCHAKLTKAGQVAASERRAAKQSSVHAESGESPGYQDGLPDGAKPSPTTASALGARLVMAASPQAASLTESLSEVLHGLAPAPQITMSDRIFDYVKSARAAELNKIELLKVELANAHSKVVRFDDFLDLYSEYSQAAASGKEHQC